MDDLHFRLRERTKKAAHPSHWTAALCVRFKQSEAVSHETASAFDGSLAEQAASGRKSLDDIPEFSRGTMPRQALARGFGSESCRQTAEFQKI